MKKNLDKYYYSNFNDSNIDNNNNSNNDDNTIILKREIDKWNNFSSILRNII